MVFLSSISLGEILSRNSLIAFNYQSSLINFDNRLVFKIIGLKCLCAKSC